MTTFESVLTAACQMSVNERLRLLDEIAATLPEDLPIQSDDELRSVVARRSAEAIAGMAVTEDWHDIRRQTFDGLGVHVED